MIDLEKYLRRTAKIEPWATTPGYMRFVGHGGAEERLRIEKNYKVQRVAFQALRHSDHNSPLYVYFLKRRVK